MNQDMSILHLVLNASLVVQLVMLLLQAQGAQPFGAGTLKELQVVGIKHNAACIGVFPIHPHGP